MSTSSSSTASARISSALADVTAKLTYRDDPDYPSLNDSYFTAFQSALSPYCIAQPTTTAQVSELIRALSPLLLQTTTDDGEQQQPPLCHLAIRGHGHTPNRGSSNTSTGVTLDLRGLQDTGMSLSADGSLVTIPAGETWERVYAYLEPSGLTVAGARVGTVGVVGFLLGGGLSMFAGRAGFGCDSVVGWEVVTAPGGEVVRAGTAEQPNAAVDLLRALRGGGNNFGVVTSVTMRTIEVPGQGAKIWGGLAMYTPQAFPALLEKTYGFVAGGGGKDDPFASMGCSMTCAMGQKFPSVLAYHTTDSAPETPASLRPFLEQEDTRPIQCTARRATHRELVNEMAALHGNNTRQIFASITVKPELALMRDMWGQWEAALESMTKAGVEGLVLTLGFHPLTKSMLEASAAVPGGNAMGIDPKDGPLLIVFVNPVWGSEKDDERVHDAVQDLLSNLKLMAEEKKLLHRFIFPNYRFDRHDVVAGYGEENLARMREVSKKYDPLGIFQHGVPGGFKLGKI